MLRNYLKITLRHLAGHKLHAAISIGGLTIGVAACLLISLYVDFEMGYDRFHENSSRIYRVTLNQSSEGESISQRAKVYGFLGPILQENFPEVEACTRLINLQGIMGNQVMAYGDRKFTEEKMYYADASLFGIFSFKFIAGDPQQVLGEPHSVVVTQSTALKYFGQESPLGKTLLLNGEETFQVTGVMADVPENSHLKFDLLLSLETLKNEKYMLGWADYLTYVLLTPQTRPEAFQTKLNSANLVARNLGADPASGQSTRLGLQPLTEIHLHSHLEGEAEINGSAVATYGLALVAFLILVIAWMNYINLSAARSLDRAKEVGIRKVVGAQRGHVRTQFLFESLVINALAFVVALLLTEELLPIFSQFLDVPLTWLAYGRLSVSLVLTVIMLFGSLLASFYPAAVLASFQPIKSLKGMVPRGRGKASLREALVVYQFAATVILMAATWAIFEQLSYMRHQELGIDIAQTLVVKAPSISDSTYTSRLDRYKTELLGHAAIRSLTVSTNVPGRESTWGGAVRRFGDNVAEPVDVDYIGIDSDFLDAYGLQLLAGRKFSPQFGADHQAVLVNDVALRQLRYRSAAEIIGQQLTAWRSQTFEVVGVVDTYQQLSLQHAQIPTVYFLRPGSGDFFSIKFQPADLPGTLALIRSEYERLFPGNPYEDFFLDDYYNRQYRADQRFGLILGVFSGLAVCIACLGLLASVLDATTRRTKEIGVRKVLGASAFNVTVLLSKDFLFLVGVANVIALPIAGLVIQKWLQNYAFRIELGIAVFAVPALAVIVIALLTVSIQAVRAAVANPVESLRYE